MAVDGSGNVYIADTGNNEVLEVDFADPPSLTFAATDVGSASAAQDVTVLNLGNAPLNISQISVSSNFTLQGPDTSCGTTQQILDPAASCVLGIEFAPMTTGSIGGSIVLADNHLNASSPQATQTITLQGTANLGTQTINFPNPGTQTYGVSPLTLTAAATSGLPVSYSLSSGPATLNGSTLTITGAGPVTVQATQAGNSNWQAATPVSVTFTVNKASPANTLQTSAAAVLLQNSVTFTAVVSSAKGTPTGKVAFMDGSTKLGSPAMDSSGTATLSVSTLASGSHSITAVYSGDAIYAGSTSPAMSEMVQDFQLAVTGSSASVAAGGNASYVLQFSLANGTTVPSAVTLSLTGLPAGATDTIAPSTIAAGSGARTVIVVVQTAATARLTLPFDRYGPSLALALFSMLGMVQLNSSKRRRAMRIFLTSLLLVAALGMCACASKTAQTYTLQLNATSGALVHSYTLNLTIQS